MADEARKYFCNEGHYFCAKRPGGPCKVLLPDVEFTKTPAPRSKMWNKPAVLKQLESRPLDERVALLRFLRTRAVSDATHRIEDRRHWELGRFADFCTQELQALGAE